MNLPTVSERPAVASGLDQTHLTGEVSIWIENVSVRYRMPNLNTRSIKEFVIRAIQRKIQFRYHWALRDVTIRVPKGEILGLVGHNGAGKTTLMKVVARIMKPTAGRVVVRGKLSALISVGAGFHVELTGRENIFLNGSMLGFSHREIEEKFESIVNFAELWDYIDQPLRTYSSGMRARLGFAVATDTKPDVLIVDEVLAVGDEAFRSKSSERMRSFRDGGTTILLVSHSMPTIQEICHRVAWIHQGHLRMIGDTESVVKDYVLERQKHGEKKNPRLRA